MLFFCFVAVVVYLSFIVRKDYYGNAFYRTIFIKINFQQFRSIKLNKIGKYEAIYVFCFLTFFLWRM